jgi:uncharacterized membrane protein
MEAPETLFVKAFRDESQADTVLKALKRLDRRGVFHIVNAAVLVRDEKGRARMKETEDVDAKRGAIFGAIAGGLLGLLGGPAGVVVGAAAGAAAGGAAAHVIDMGFSDKYLKELQDELPPGSSAIVALVEHEWVTRVERELEQHEGRLFRQALKQSIAAQIAADAEVQEEATD